MGQEAGNKRPPARAPGAARQGPRGPSREPKPGPEGPKTGPKRPKKGSRGRFGAQNSTLLFNMIENIELDKTKPHTAGNILKISEIMQIAYSLRSIHLADPDFYPVPMEAFLDKNIAEELLLKVNNSKTSDSSHYDPQNLKIKENTTHYSVVDKYGNAVSTTTTLNTAYGSGVVIKGTGLLLNNEMDDFSASLSLIHI